MLQSITTKYHGPTIARGSRISATSASGHRLTVSYDHSLNGPDNHKEAAIALCKKLEWHGTLQGGSTPTGYCFVFVSDDAFTV